MKKCPICKQPFMPIFIHKDWAWCDLCCAEIEKNKNFNRDFKMGVSINKKPTIGGPFYTEWTEGRFGSGDRKGPDPRPV